MKSLGRGEGTPARNEHLSKDGRYPRRLSPAKATSCIVQLIMALAVSANLEILDEFSS